MVAENGTHEDTHNRTPDGTHGQESPPDADAGQFFGMLEPKTPLLGNVPPRPIVDGWKDRDEWIGVCVALGMSANQISLLSLSWPQPMQAVRHVYDKIGSLGLQKLYAKGAKRRASAHSKTIIEAFMKITGQAFEYGLPVTEILRGSLPEEGARVKPDLGLKIGTRQFYIEIQLSKLQFTRWADKQRRYLHLYKLIRRPFRSLFLIDRQDDLSAVRRYARSVLRDHPRLNLFYFLTWHEFVRERDVLKEPIWRGAWESKERHSLL